MSIHETLLTTHHSPIPHFSLTSLDWLTYLTYLGHLAHLTLVPTTEDPCSLAASHRSRPLGTQSQSRSEPRATNSARPPPSLTCPRKRTRPLASQPRFPLPSVDPTYLPTYLSISTLPRYGHCP